MSTATKSAYFEKLRDPRWQRKRLKIMERDLFKCHDCDDEGSTLNVHHIHYEKGDPWQTRDELLLTLCESCHKKRALVEGQIRIALGIVMGKLQHPELEFLLAQMEDVANQPEDSEGGIHVTDSFTYDHESDGRWFAIAYNNPSFRPIYEKVMGRKKKIKWPTAKQRAKQELNTF